jgi:mycothiol synthase
MAKKQLPEGWRFRPLQIEDLEQTVALFNACSQAMIGADEFTFESVHNEWKTPKFDLEQSTQTVFTNDGKLVGAFEIWDLDELPVLPWIFGNVHPYFEGRGIGTYLLDWAVARVQRVFERVPEEARVAMLCGTYHGYQPAHQLLEDWGMQPTRYFWRMVIDLKQRPKEPQWPSDIELRPYRHDQDAEKFYRAEDEAFQDHWGYVTESFEVGYERWRHRSLGRTDFDPELWSIAWHDDEIAGVIRSRLKADDDPEMGWVSVLAVRKPWRNRGLGLALLQHSFVDFFERGRASVGLGVDAANFTGATRLYEKAGMRTSRQFDVYEKELRAGVEMSKR